MSLILKGIDMPKGTDGLSITFHSQYGAMETHILDVAQVIQIPKGHGRIGDLDELQVNVIKAMTYGDALYEVKHHPAILESEVMPK